MEAEPQQSYGEIAYVKWEMQSMTDEYTWAELTPHEKERWEFAAQAVINQHAIDARFAELNKKWPWER